MEAMLASGTRRTLLWVLQCESRVGSFSSDRSFRVAQRPSGIKG